MAFMTKEEYEEYVAKHASNVVSTEDIAHIKTALQPLIGAQFNILSIPKEILLAFEPSQIGTIIGSLMDACIPQLSKITESNTFDSVGLRKNDGILGEREGYPDYLHTSGKRLELKLLFVDNPNIEMKKPPTPREPSARLTQKVTSVFIDLSSLFYNEDRADALIAPAELMINVIQKEQSVALYIIIERQYSKQVRDLLYYKIDKILDLESFLEIEKDPVKNIVDIDQPGFDGILDYLNNNLFGNELFKKRLKEELTKYRLFNRIGQQPIFSVLICGASGIGKTEVARLLHQRLAADEPMIKINFGNYSAQDALNSLIGSPRGYIGSNKGELPDKLMRSRSKVILIDEFEKASKPVYNFFLQLLEEGKFTDSLGRE